ncbi:MAG: DoxX family protein [Burkholderiales bacterium]
MNALLPLVGRILLALIFVISGFKKIGGFEQTAGYMATKGLPYVEPLLVLTILIELGGGMLLILGWKARWAAAAIFLFIIPVTIIFHPFWAVDAAQMQAQFNNFFKNLCIMGGMLYIIAYGAGAFSLDKR